MATNIVKDHRGDVRAEMTFGGAKTKGSVELITAMPLFLLENTDANNKASCILLGIGLTANLAVTGQNAVPAPTAVAVGNKLYKDGTEINLDATNGTFVGYALGTVNAGATTTIEVALAS